MLAKTGCIALNDLALTAPGARRKVVRDGPDLVPPLRAWSATGPFGTFDFGQVLQPAGQFLCDTAGGAETVGQSDDQIKGEVLFVRHCSSPSFQQRCHGHTSNLDRWLRSCRVRSTDFGRQALSVVRIFRTSRAVL